MMHFFEKLSDLFIQRHVKPTWDLCPNWKNDPWDSVQLFLRSYAFEHQGRAQDFPHVAVDTIKEIRNGTLDRNAARQAWEIFSKKMKKMGSKGLNHAINPLCPKGTKYVRKYRGQEKEATIGQVSAIELVTGKLEGQCIVPWAKGLIETENVKQAHHDIKDISGVGNKIASLFLRDIAVMFGLAPHKNRHLLQPIDTWIKLVAQELSALDLSNSGCANYIVDKSNEPEKVNMGMWYFCAQVAGSSQYLVRKGLANKGYREGLVGKHLDRLRNDAKITEQFRRDWG